MGSADELDGDSEVEVAPVAVGGHDRYVAVLARARQARSASESPFALVRGRNRAISTPVGVGERFEDQRAVARLEAVGYLLRIAAVGGHLRERSAQLTTLMAAVSVMASTTASEPGSSCR